MVDGAAVGAAVADFAAGGLDLLVVCAGCYADGAALAAEPGLGERMMAVNLLGLINCFDAGVRAMRGSGAGQLAAVASIAGLLPDYPGASLYSSNKRAVIALCQLYRHTLAPRGIAVTTIVPGYVDTAALRALNGGSARAKPFLLSEAEAVARMVDAIGARRAKAVFPWQLHLLVRLMHTVPGPLRRLRKR